MRRAITLALAWVGTTTFAVPQDNSQDLLPLLDSKPDISIRVRHHSMGADVVDITVTRADYPPQLLQQQINNMALYGGNAPRGITMTGVEEGGFLRANFAVDGIIDRSGQYLHLAALVKPFLGSPSPYVNDAFLVFIDGEQAVDGRTLIHHASESVQLDGRVMERPAGIEYQIQVRTQDPSELDIPPAYQGLPITEKPVPKQNPGRQMFIISLAVAAGLAAVALVYSLARRGKG